MIAYHEAGHALLAHIVGRGMTIHKVTIVPRGGALGYNLYTPTDERILATRDDLITRIVVLLGGRAGEEVALGEVSNGAGDDLERATAIARAMVFDWGLGESLTTRTVRADNFALSEDTKRQRDAEQSQICDHAYAEARRLLEEHRDALERLASKLLERETLDREDVATMLHDVQRVGTLAFSWPTGPAGPRAPALEGVAGPSAGLSRGSCSWPSSWLWSCGSSPALATSAFLASTAARASRTRVASEASSPLAASVPASIRSNAALPSAADAVSTSPSSLRSCSLSCCA